jgi:hypothetical protein
MPSKNTVQIIIEWDTEYPTEEKANEVAEKRVEELRKMYPKASNIEPHVWTLKI